MNYIQTFDGNVKAKGVTTDTLFYSSIATDGLEIVDGVVTKYEGTAKKVYIPDYYNGILVTTIGEDAFANNTSIVVVRFPKHLTTIAEGAFYGCTGLVGIDLGEHIATIGQNAFVGCTGLEDVTIRTTTLPQCEDAFAIAEQIPLYRPFNVDDRDEWKRTFMDMGFAPITYFTENKAVAYADRASRDGNGDSFTSNYAKINGTYSNMTVGNATNASKATTTDFTNKTWQSVAGGSLTLTTGTWQIYATITANLTGSGTSTFNVNIGLVYFDGETDTQSATPFYNGLYHIALSTDTNGATTASIHATSGSASGISIASLHYREIK